ncbi:HNH endonuclease signature motif containing protein [uncultured Polaribacter sp.]|uniref:HNH endonuclease n=1 Tax=uncultured Polaribacter sp. TaxID=174711 RepID=UPI0030D732E3|tara:strand:+ start:345 stop:968 length:624 start_codon:yes stop_codon:yes gene_type:complete
MKVREFLPIRKSTPTKSPNEGKWTEHKSDLQEDFHSHCGYCGSYDGYRHTWYEVDHFIPKSLFKDKISNVEYSNLVYSCKFCNNNKSSKWPTEDITIPNSNNKGFIDPCLEEYDEHLYRTDDGSIMWNTQLGKWMWETAFKFDERNYAIKLLWEVNNIRKLVLAYAKEMARMDEESEEYKLINEIAGPLSIKYVVIHNDLMNHYNSL